MEITANSPRLLTATCPACGMLCDDIVVEAGASVKVKNGCAKSVVFFEQALNNTSPTIAGRPTNLDSAIEAAAGILSKSHQPLFAGLGTEVQGMRALVSLAQRTGATLDHMHSESSVRNTLAMQNSGWQTTTLTEVKNRADVILAIGTDIVSSHPRFFDKLVQNQESLYRQTKPEVMYLGLADQTTHLPEIMNALNMLANGKQPSTSQIAGVSTEWLQEILQKLKSAQYAVIVWSARNLDFPHAELTVQSITRLIATLNETTRVTGLPLNSGDGDTSINYASTWLTAYPTRNRLTHNHAEYDTQQFSAKAQLSSCDALLWVSTFNAYAPPKTEAPTIVIGHPNMQFEQVPDVFIPVGVPGLDHTGTMFRMDGSVVLPLKKVRHANLPRLAEVVQQIEALLA